MQVSSPPEAVPGFVIQKVIRPLSLISAPPTVKERGGMLTVYVGSRAKPFQS